MTDARTTRDYENGRLICQLCIEWVAFEDLWVDDAGDTYDICKECGDENYGAP